MRTSWIGAAAILALVLTIGYTNPSANAQQRPPGTLKVGNEDLGPEDGAVLVSVTKGGTIVKSSDCSSTHPISWETIAEGDYEVRFESPNHLTLLKRIHITAGEETVLSAKLPEGKGTVPMGGGPSIAEMDSRIRRLETQVAQLRKK